jgi:hypothetical protein
VDNLKHKIIHHTQKPPRWDAEAGRFSLDAERRSTRKKEILGICDMEDLSTSYYIPSCGKDKA